ncbi:hypothetical protein FB451DRAFT_992862, partial [Mycena latifolia]
IASLFSFPNLTSIVAQASEICLVDDDLVQLATWCRLQILDLGPRTYWHDIPGLRGLVPFAEHCPYLRNLTIFLDTTTSVPTNDEFFQIRSKGISNRNLTHLNVGNSPINPATVAVTASFVSMLFPCLQSITTVNEVDERVYVHDLKELWAQVLQLASTLASVYAGYETYVAS